jgi:transposase
MPSNRLSLQDRKALLDHYRRSAEPEVRLRAHILLLLDAGHPWATISAVLFCSFSTISRWKRRFDAEGVEAVLGRPRGRHRSGTHVWATLVVRWVLALSPAEFRFTRSRWSCEAAAVVLREDFGVPVGRETVCLWLRAAGLVWRRPRPVIRPKDPEREAKLRDLRALLHGLPADETAVFMDEVDVNLNPKVGCMWMKRGEQAAVETPGTNEKRYLAGSIHWRTGRVFLTEVRLPSRNGGFCAQTGIQATHGWFARPGGGTPPASPPHCTPTAWRSLTAIELATGTRKPARVCRRTPRPSRCWDPRHSSTRFSLFGIIRFCACKRRRECV